MSNNAQQTKFAPFIHPNHFMVFVIPLHPSSTGPFTDTIHSPRLVFWILLSSYHLFKPYPEVYVATLQYVPSLRRTREAWAPSRLKERKIAGDPCLLGPHDLSVFPFPLTPERHVFVFSTFFTHH